MDLRRTAVTEMMEGGVDLANIMQVTGHKNIQSVKPYMVNTLSGATKALAARGNDDDDQG
jgi:site-specific recombinase XerD